MACYAYLDFCFLEFCNLTCSYCRKDNDGMLRDADPAIVRDCLETFLAHSEAACFKVSGYGEASLWPPLADTMAWASGRFPSIQVMTNGSMPGKVFEALAAIPNMVFCLTIDSLREEGNSLRTGGNIKLHEKMLRFADAVVAANRRLELNCVLTGRNTAGFPDHVAGVRARFGDGVLIYPFPVRPFAGLVSQAEAPQPEVAQHLAEVILRDFGQYAPVLPPRPYMERLFAHMAAGGRRTTPCWVPALNYGVGPSLSPLRCACLGHTKPSDDLANMLFPDCEHATPASRMVDTVGSHAGTLATGRIDERCDPCFTHYEVLNLFLDGVVTLGDLVRLPAFAEIGAAAVLDRMKTELRPAVAI